VIAASSGARLPGYQFRFQRNHNLTLQTYKRRDLSRWLILARLPKARDKSRRYRMCINCRG
jgi:hypothetical protein